MTNDQILMKVEVPINLTKREAHPALL